MDILGTGSNILLIILGFGLLIVRSHILVDDDHIRILAAHRCW